jgi:hypothetical protein
MMLRAIAHARAGDKGDISSICVIAFRPEDYPVLAEHVTAARVRAHFADIVKGAVERYELPGLGALNFVLHDTLSGGVTRSLALDTHGKSLSSSLLEMLLPDLAPLAMRRDGDAAPESGPEDIAATAHDADASTTRPSGRAVD